ncbi:rhomboid family intramembrane serine protease [Desulfuromonas sp.]|uniref:rhomboid family intramembrane serine protease n=1 Tax=Desulfuromonas sp. TaxID=892 RepID=UPI0025C67EF5|nr:rhomboid family intramembrane serine protease [Desulfuromonas sp.]
MNHNPFFSRPGPAGTNWHWRLRRWKRTFGNFFRSEGAPGHTGPSLTRIIIFANLALYTLMVLQGTAAGLGLRPILSPTTYLLIHSGAQYWPLVLVEGEWWRCLTYAFTHGGLIHLAFNMVVLYQVGPLVESEIGPSRFLFLYTLAALTGTAAGYFWHPMTPVVGASGSLFGLIGFAVAYYHRMGPPGHHIRNFMFQWAAFAFVFGLVVGADNAGHLGGALGGAALGLVLPLGVRGRRTAAPLFNLLGGLSLAAVLVSLAMLVISWFARSG